MVKNRRLCLLAIAGMKHYDGMNMIPVIIERGTLILRRQPDNPYDKFAVEVFTPLSKTDEPTKLGYIPRTHSEIFSQLLDAGVVIRATAVKPVPTGIQMALSVEVDDGKEE